MYFLHYAGESNERGFPVINLNCFKVPKIVFFFNILQGGLKAVVWTDTVQTIIMFGAMVVTVIVGTVRVGGVQEVWSRNQQGDRIEFFK